MSGPVGHTSYTHALDRVRLLLQRYITQRIEWLAAIQDGPEGEALVRFLRGRPFPRTDDLAAIQADLGAAPQPAPADSVWARFSQLRRSLSLADWEADLLWILLAPELEGTFLEVYRRLFSDRRQRYCDEDFLAALLSPEGPWFLRSSFGPWHTLRRLRLVEAVPTLPNEVTQFAVSQRLIDYLVGRDALPELLANRLDYRPAARDRTFGELPVLPTVDKALAAAHGHHRFVLLEGSAESGLETLLQRVSSRAGLGLVVADLESLLGGPEPELWADNGRLLRWICREVRLSGAALLLRGVEAFDSVPAHQCRLFADLLFEEPGPVYLHSDGPVPTALYRHVLPRLQPLHLRLPPLTTHERRALWGRLLVRRGPPDASQQDRIEKLSALPLGPRSMALARSIVRATGDDVLEVAERLTADRLTELATRVTTTLTWADVVLPETVKEAVDDVLVFGKNYHTIMDTWGLGSIASGRGIKMLFSGPSGTGKTLISGLIARELGQQLYRIDLSRVTSKYIGETDKHLARIFDEAERGGMALLFDEADSLFAARTDVKSSTDRYANQSVNFLLQRLEVHDGLIILTTNLADSIDAAFVRRLTYHIRFQRPEPKERERLWAVHLPDALPVTPDLSLKSLAAQYDLAGGEIRKAVLAAASHALADGRHVIGLGDLDAAARAQYTSAGRLPPGRPLG